MDLSNDEIHEIARRAVEVMAEALPPNATFPFDLVWQYADGSDAIPSERKSDKWRRLVKDGYIELTGGMTKAVSEARAGSSTREYRFGPRFQPQKAVQKTNEDDVSAMLANLQAAMESDGYYVSTAELTNFYLAMSVSPLVILSGISGTGKSLLPRYFAKYTQASFHSIPVQPQWSDNADLFGYVPTLSPSTHKPGKIIPALAEAAANPNKLIIALLDEMNLAPVEHYFSDFLSVAETRRRAKNGSVASDVLPIELPDPAEGELAEIAQLRNLMLPQNLRVVGTANMDETTKPFSPKVLDRTFAIEFDDPDLMVFASGGPGNDGDLNALAQRLIDPAAPISVHEAMSASQELFLHVAALLGEIQDILAPAGVKFGYRTRDAILLYLHNWQIMGLSDRLSPSAALDFCLLQKVLPKISGIGDALSDVLTELCAWLGKNRDGTADASALGFNGPFERSLSKAERMKALLESDGATHFWGV